MFSSFMTNTWIAASIIAVVAGVVGFFVVIRGASFAAHALPLCTFPGAACATLLGANELVGLIVFAGLGVIGISQLSRWQRSDVATALTFVMLLGLGSLFLSMSREYSEQVYSLLFGEVLGVSTAEIIPVAITGGIVVIVTTLLFRPLLLTSLSAELAEARGIPSRRVELLFLSILALATAMALPVVGALLVFSLMVGPASCARSLTDRALVALLLSVAIALASVWAAIALSYISNWPVGFFIGGLSALSYGFGRAYSWAREAGKNQSIGQIVGE